jgi:hypothetical protein
VGNGRGLGLPVSMSAGADEPACAASRVSVITSVGYCGFVAGPPLIGFIANQSTVAHALVVVGILLALAIAIAGAACRPPPKAALPVMENATFEAEIDPRRSQ